MSASFLCVQCFQITRTPQVSRYLVPPLPKEKGSFCPERNKQRRDYHAAPDMKS